MATKLVQVEASRLLPKKTIFQYKVGHSFVFSKEYLQA